MRIAECKSKGPTKTESEVRADSWFTFHGSRIRWFGVPSSVCGRHYGAYQSLSFRPDRPLHITAVIYETLTILFCYTKYSRPLG